MKSLSVVLILLSIGFTAFSEAWAQSPSRRCAEHGETREEILFLAISHSPSEWAQAETAASQGGGCLRVLGASSSFSLSQLDQYITETRRQRNRTVRAIVISGHYDGQSFFREGNSVHVARGLLLERIGRLNAALSSEAHRPKGLLLWGCYTGTPWSLRSWRAALPHLSFLVGFSGAAPTSTTESGSDILRQSIATALQLDDGLSRQRVQSLVNSASTSIMSTDSLSSFLAPACSRCDGAEFRSCSSADVPEVPHSTERSHQDSCPADFMRAVACSFRAYNLFRLAADGDHRNPPAPIDCDENHSAPLCRAEINLRRYRQCIVPESCVEGAMNQILALQNYGRVNCHLSRFLSSELAAHRTDWTPSIRSKVQRVLDAFQNRNVMRARAQELAESLEGESGSLEQLAKTLLVLVMPEPFPNRSCIPQAWLTQACTRPFSGRSRAPGCIR